MARPAFMSKVPGPCRRPPRISTGICASVPTGQTVSKCPSSSTCRVPLAKRRPQVRPAPGPRYALDCRTRRSSSDASGAPHRVERVHVAARRLEARQRADRVDHPGGRAAHVSVSRGVPSSVIPLLGLRRAPPTRYRTRSRSRGTRRPAAITNRTRRIAPMSTSGGRPRPPGRQRRPPNHPEVGAALAEERRRGAGRCRQRLARRQPRRRQQFEFTPWRLAAAGMWHLGVSTHHDARAVLVQPARRASASS